MHEHHKRFAAAYGKWEISINYHMALHICDIISDMDHQMVIGAMLTNR